MAHVLSLTDGTTTVLLAASGQNIIDYVPSPPDPNSPDVTESAKIVFTDATSIDNVETTLRNVERLFSAASTWTESERGARVYVNFDPGTSGCTFRSQLLGGVVDLDKDYLGNSFLNRRVEATLHWTRVPYFESPELFCGSATLYNHSDSGTGHVNYMDIAGSDIGGDYPAGCRIEVVNLAASTLGKVWVGVNAYKGTTMPLHILEGELATGLAGVAHEFSSSGSYGLYGPAASTSTLAARWAIAASDANRFAGHWYHLLLRTLGTSASLYVRAETAYTATTYTLAQASDEVRFDGNCIQDLGVLQLPPYLSSETDLTAFDVLLYARGASTISLSCDFVQLTPTDGWRAYSTLGSIGFGQNGTLKDDSITGRVYVETAASTPRSGHFIASGPPIYLQPNRDHRFYVLAETTGGLALIAQTFTFRVYYRQRRQTL